MLWFNYSAGEPRKGTPDGHQATETEQGSMNTTTARGYQSQGWRSGHALTAMQPEDCKPSVGEARLPG
jgi:hypothetical protein